MPAPPEDTPKTGDSIQEDGYIRILMIAFSLICVVMFVKQYDWD